MRLERERQQPPRPERRVVVAGPSTWICTPAAELADVLVERRLEPALAQAAAAQPLRRERLHLASSARASMSGAPNSSSGRVVPRPSDSVVPSSMTVPA